MPRKPQTTAKKWTDADIARRAQTTPADVPAMLQNRTPALRALLEATPLDAKTEESQK